jgi:hypothetical protein
VTGHPMTGMLRKHCFPSGTHPDSESAGDVICQVDAPARQTRLAIPPRTSANVFAACLDAHCYSTEP